MRKIREIHNVTFPISKLNEKYFLIGINGIFKLLDGIEVKNFIGLEIKETGHQILNNILYLYDEKRIIGVDLEDVQSTKFVDYTADRLWIFNSEYIIYVTENKNSRDFKIDFYSKNKDTILWSITDKMYLSNLSDKFLIFVNLTGTIYKRLNTISGEEIWSLDFSENKVVGNTLLIDNILVFSTTNHHIIGIDIETGKELWRLEKINAGSFQIQPETKYLVSLNANSAGDNWYYIINPLNGEILVNKKFEKFYYDATANKACITDTYYYFISNVMGDGGYKDERVTHLGCINLQSHDLEWIEEVGATSDRRSEYQKPEINGNKIYLLDGEKTLHIYELE